MNLDLRSPVSEAAGHGLEAAVTLALAEVLPPDSVLAGRLRRMAPAGLTASAVAAAALAGRWEADAALIGAARKLGLDRSELLAIALAASVERRADVPSGLRALQGDAFGPWPSRATVALLLRQLGLAAPEDLPGLALAFDLGILVRVGERMPSAEDRFALAPAVLAALGLATPDFAPRFIAPTCPVPPSWQASAESRASAILGRDCIVLRDGDPGDLRLFAALLARGLGRRPLDADGVVTGLGAASSIAGWCPVQTVTTRPGERLPLAGLPGLDGPRIVLAGRAGGITCDDREVIDLPLPPLTRGERRALWEATLPGSDAGTRHAGTRIGPARLAATAARMQAEATGSGAGGMRRAMAAEYRADMEPHARLVPREAAAGDFVADDTVRSEMQVLLERCRYRASGAEMEVQGVRALLTGPSGTGKTLAAAWIATEIDLPLFRIDLSTIVSKYIGETEENLARILDRAETGDVVLLMDEADSLFGARTDTQDSSDRFANNQTNFLLGRIEGFDGICLLTSNAAERIDTAFLRRLDQVIEVPLPAARERRRIWQRHLGQGHGLGGGELNRLAGLVDLSGGHIRNIVHAARVLAPEGRPGPAEIARAATMEYRKLGRTPPRGLAP